MKLIVGLGNPEKKYKNTRHNAGFLVLDNILGEVNWKEKFSALYYEENKGTDKVIYIKPQTYMNMSGEAVIKFVNYYGINNEDILVIQDDIDMDFGKIRIKNSSSYGGHNGILSIITNLNTEDFHRLKIGIKNENKNDTKDFVLSSFSKDELNILKEQKSVFIDIVDLFIKGDILSAMNKYN